jgi:hypothetical protein
MAYDPNIQFTEDAAHTSGDKGTEVLAVRNDSRGALAGTDGDYSPLQVNASGDLRVDASAVTQPVSLATNTPTLQSGSTTAVTQATGTNLHAVIDSGTVSTITNVVHVDDNSGSLTVDNGGTFAVQADTELTTGDLDTGAGTDTRAVVGLVGSKSGGGVLIPGDATKGLAVDLTATGQNTTALKTDGSATTQPVSGTVNAAQSGTWTVQPGNTANTTAWKVDGSAVTQPVSGTVTANLGTGGTAATSLGKAEDAAHTTGDTGVMSLAVRSNTAASTSGTDGDYQPLITNTTGHLWVDASGQTLTVGSHAVTNAGTFAVQATIAAGATSIAKAEDVASADGDVGVPFLAVRKATPANTSGTDGDYEFAQISAGRLWASATIDAALPAGANAIGKLATNSGVTIGAVEIAAAQTLATVTTVGTVTTLTGTTTLTPGTAAANLGKAEDAVHGSGDVGVFSLNVGNEAQSTLAADGDYIGQAVDTKGNSMTVGNLAHDAVDAGAPVKTGGQARITNPTAVADADRSNFITDKLGKQVTVGSIRDLKGRQRTVITASTSETTIVTAVAATFLDVYRLVVANTSATACQVDIRDATAGSIIETLEVPANGTVGWSGPESAAANQTTVNNNWSATCGTSVSSIIVTAYYVKNT